MNSVGLYVNSVGLYVNAFDFALSWVCLTKLSVDVQHKKYLNPVMIKIHKFRDSLLHVRFSELLMFQTHLLMDAVM